MSQSTLLARLNDGRELPIEACNCGHCSNEWFMSAISPEWMPSFCPYCGIKFVRKTIGDGDNEELDDFLPADGETNFATCLNKWIDKDSVAAIKEIIDSCPGEIIAIGAALLSLDITTRDHAIDLAHDGFMFRTEEAECRANRYRETLAEITRIWSD